MKYHVHSLRSIFTKPTEGQVGVYSRGIVSGLLIVIASWILCLVSTVDGIRGSFDSVGPWI